MVQISLPSEISAASTQSIASTFLLSEIEGDSSTTQNGLPSEFMSELRMYTTRSETVENSSFLTEYQLKPYCSCPSPISRTLRAFMLVGILNLFVS